MIQLKCPHCRTDLEIDEGFRGGVCRCFSCGTLMTVPEEDSAGPPGSLRPPRPKRGATSSASPRHEEAEVASLVKAQFSTDEGDELATYVTRSGRELRFSRSQLTHVPVARRRKGVRIGVTAAMGAIALALVGLVAWFTIWLFSPAAQPTAEDIYAGLFDITVNPYSGAEANFMGLPVAARTAYLIDSSAAMRQQFDLVAQAAIRSVQTLPPERAVQVILWTEVAPTAFPEGLTPAGQIDAEAMALKLESVFSSGAVNARPAFVRALSEKPDQITLVCRSLPDEQTGHALADELKASGTKLLIVHLDAIDGAPESELWRELAQTTGGRYFTLNSGRLRRWYEDYLDQHEAETSS